MNTTHAIIIIAAMYAALIGYSVYWMWFHPTQAFFPRKKQPTHEQ